MRRELAVATAVAVFTLFGYASLRAQQTSAALGGHSLRGKANRNGRIHALRTSRAGNRQFQNLLRSHRHNAGAKFFYNPIRKGSAASDEAVFDSMTGAPLPFDVVSGAEARKDPLMADADADTNFIKISLARPCRRMARAES